MAADNNIKTDLSICKACNNMAPTTHEDLDGKMYLVKNCPECGVSKFLISSDAERYKQKRDLCNYQGNTENCSLLCVNCDHGKKPALVFLDVTNRCNMNCPICLANISAMGFKFDPPIEYFDKIFKTLSKIRPRPRIQLFGGEPTVREDLIQIIELATSYGLFARVVTNGIRLADEEYCKRLLKTKARLMFSFDGLNREIYERIRHNPESYDLKLKALENIRKHHKGKITIMCAISEGLNGKDMGGLLDFCRRGSDYISALDFIPLTATWGSETVDAESSTMEDVENILADTIPGLSFFPAALLYKFNTLSEIFGGRLSFSGAHPNCESVSALISNGQEFRPISEFLKKSQDDVISEAISLDEEIGRKLEHSRIGKILGGPWKKILIGLAALKFLRKNLDFHKIFGPHPNVTLIKIGLGLLRGKKMKDVLRQYTKWKDALRLMVLPFEDLENIESDRLVDCPSSFAYEHPPTREIRLMPVCAWPIYKNGILRETAKNYD